MTAINKRPNAALLFGFGGRDLGFRERLHEWMERSADLRVEHIKALASWEGTQLSSKLDTARTAIVTLSKHTPKEAFASEHWNCVANEVSSTEDFRVIAIATDEHQTETPRGIERLIRMPKLSAEGLAALMSALFGSEGEPKGKAVYLSRGWRSNERKVSDGMLTLAQRLGFKIICDWPDQVQYDHERVRRLMSGTGGHIAVVPHRGDGRTSPFILREIELGRDLDLPQLALVERGIDAGQVPAGIDSITFDAATAEGTVEPLSEALEILSQRWRHPTAGEHIFLGNSLEDGVVDQFRTTSHMVEKITGLSVKTGYLVAGSETQSDIVRLIRAAEFCIIDITNLTYRNLPPKTDFALNSCIEAGIAVGAGKPIYLTCKGERRSPPFMIRDRQAWFYRDETDLVGVLRQICALHRRMVL